jgi:hypothetical protein
MVQFILQRGNSSQYNKRKHCGEEEGPGTFHQQLAQNRNKGGGRKKRRTGGEEEAKEDTHTHTLNPSRHMQHQ